jgi:hypothetical protein
MLQYQPSSLLQTRFGNNNGNKKGTKAQKIANSSRGGVEIAIPTNVATHEEFEAFNVDISTSNVDGSSLTTGLSPPLFRYMQQKGMIKMVPHDVEFLAQYGAKPRDRCVRVATNPNFVSMPDCDYGYHRLGDKGDGYKVSKQGQISFPTVYYICVEGFAISCNRAYVTPKFAKTHLQNGTADILGRRWVIKGGRKEYRYFIRSYHVQSSKTSLQTQYRSFNASHYDMSKSLLSTELAQVVLTTLECPRPRGFIPQHDSESWDNSIEVLRWIPRRENNQKENLDPQ